MCLKDGPSLSLVSCNLFFFISFSVGINVCWFFFSWHQNSFSFQGEQLCWFFQLQVFSPLPRLLYAVLRLHCSNSFSVFPQILGSECDSCFMTHVQHQIMASCCQLEVVVSSSDLIVLSYMILTFLTLLFLPFSGGLAKRACKVPRSLPHVCGSHVLCQSHVPLWLPLLACSQEQIHVRWDFTYLFHTLTSLVSELRNGEVKVTRGGKLISSFDLLVFRGLLSSSFCQWTRQKWL